MQAGKLVERLREYKPDFVLYDLELSLKLAESFQQGKQYELVLWLANDAHTRFDPSLTLAELYLLTAKVLLSKSNNPAKAQVYLNYIQTHFANEPVGQSGKILQKHIDKLKHSR